ncbi:MAG: sigma-70 family RNA polymerase sigma factor [Rhodothermales bacterium]
MAAAPDVTQLLLDIPDDREAAYEALLPLVYDELHRIARVQLRRGSAGETLNATALVHEVYLRLVDQTRAQWNDRVHFYAVAAKAMRRILIDYARRQKAQKRGGNQPNVTLEEGLGRVDPWARADELLSLDAALTQLATLDERLAHVIEYRFFGDMNQDEIAEVLGCSVRTVRRSETKARLLLQDLMSG